MEFYHNIITEKSFKVLQTLRKQFKFILIGGWAVFLYAHSLKSKDIDLIIDYDELNKLKENYEVFKNERLKKYELKLEGADVDIYLPHYSELGIDISRIQKSAVIREGFKIPKLEILFLLKLYAYNQRQGSLKGKKDEIDIFSLAFLPEFNWEEYKKFVNEFQFENYHQFFISLLKRTTNIPSLAINEQKMAKERKEIINKFQIE